MNPAKSRRPRKWWQADFGSPRDFVRHAVLLVVLFGVAHICGLREYTSFLNGTAGPVGTDWQTSAFLGVIYVLLYLGGVLLVPTFLLAAGLLAAWQRWPAKRRRTSRECRN